MNASELYETARRMMNEHGLNDWKFEVARSRKRYGCCKFRFKKILVSGPLAQLNETSHTIDTILHEIAHALVGPGQGHGPVWRQKAMSLGCNGERCYSGEVVKPMCQFTGTCPNGHTAHRERLPKREVSCSRCSHRFDPRFLFKWERN